MQVTAMGGFLDTFVDKILIHVLIFSPPLLLLYNPWLAIGSLSRDALVEILRGHSAFQKQALPANIWGKLKFGLQSMSITCTLATLCPPNLHQELASSANVFLGSAIIMSFPGIFVLIRTWISLVVKQIPVGMQGAALR